MFCPPRLSLTCAAHSLCTGVMLWRASAWTRDFLARWWAAGATLFSGTFLRSFSWEQRILNSLWRDEAARFFVVPHCTLNAPCDAAPASGALVVHCMGAAAAIRVARLSVAARALEQSHPDAEATSGARSTSSGSGPAAHQLLLLQAASDEQPLAATLARELPHLRLVAPPANAALSHLLAALRAASVLVALDGDAPLAGALLRALDAHPLVLDVRRSAHLPAACSAVVRSLRDAGMSYHHVVRSSELLERVFQLVNAEVS